MVGRDGTDTGFSTAVIRFEPPPVLEGFQVLDQIVLLCGRQIEAQRAIVVVDDIGQRRGATIVEVRRMLHEAAEWCRAIRFLSSPGSVAGIHSRFTRSVELSTIDIGEGRADVTRRTSRGATEYVLAPSDRGRVDTRLRRFGCGETQMVLAECRQVGRRVVG